MSIASYIDHTLLKPDATGEQIDQLCAEAREYGFASVCVNPYYVARCVKNLKGTDVKVCTVIGFPHGNHRTDIKLAEAEAALNDGCVELDMVLNIGKLIAGDTDYVYEEIAAICTLAHSRGAKVKVILETCYLNDEQKKTACQLCTRAGADWVKTSTGYGSSGCTLDDLRLMRAAVPESVQVKGSGGIRDLDTVLAARAIGASRCGVSATVKIMEEAEKRYAEGTLTEATQLKEMEGGY